MVLLWCSRHHMLLTIRGPVAHKCVSKLTIIGLDNGLSRDHCQAIIWNNTGICLIGSLGTNFSEIWSEIHAFSFTKMHLKMSPAKWRTFCHGRNVLDIIQINGTKNIYFVYGIDSNSFPINLLLTGLDKWCLPARQKHFPGQDWHRFCQSIYVWVVRTQLQPVRDCEVD